MVDARSDPLSRRLPVAPVPDLLAGYGVTVVFAWAFAVQAGLPAPAVPLLLGAGVDNGVHMVHQYRHEPDAAGDLLGTTTARAVVLTGLTNVAGFSNLLVSPHPGTASMGLVLTMGMIYTLLTTLVVVPALLMSRPDTR